VPRHPFGGRIARSLADPDAPSSTSTGTRVYQIRSLDFGDESSDAWRGLGLDIDDTATTRDSSDVCQLAAGAATVTQQDGNGGIDNSFGENLLPILVTVMGSDAPARLNASFVTGGPVNQFEVRGLDVALGDATVTGSFDGAPFAGAWLTGGTVVSGPSAKEASLLLGAATLTGAETAELTFAITHIQMVAPLTSDGSGVQHGVLSAIMPTAEAVTAVEQFARALDPNVDPSVLQTLDQQVAQASDILVDGTQDPSKPCNGISVGLGFTATVVTAARALRPSVLAEESFAGAR
jgi:hypothetical protein